MSDTFQSYVFGEALVGDGQADFRRVTAYLFAEEIIGEETAGNVLGDGEGYVAGPRAASILVEDNSDWRHLVTSGVALRTGRIIEASNEFSFGRCPNCGVAIDAESDAFTAVDDALNAYREGHGDEVECPTCQTRRKLSEWDFGHGLAVGQAMAEFWNWPNHVEGLDSRFETLSGMKCTKVWGKL